MSKGGWLSQVGLALTRLGNALLGGLAEESLSSRAARADGNGKLWGRIARPLIDWVFAKFGAAEHCLLAYLSDRSKPALPTINRDD
jgi:hypothetical protein